MSVNRKTGNGLVSWCVTGLCLLLLAGCGPQSDRSSLEGTVTLNGQPLAEGSIALRPLPGTRGPTAGGKIANGTFAILPAQGTFTGTFRVEITASRKTGKQTKDAMLDIMVDDGGHPVIRADLQKIRLELVALADIHRMRGVGDAQFLEQDRDLPAVRRGPKIEIEHYAYSAACLFVPPPITPSAASLAMVSSS